MDVDLAVVGAGGAGLALAVHLERACAQARVAPPSMAVIDPVRRSGSDRTWCFWDRGHSPVEEAVSATWRRFAVGEPGGRQRVRDLGPLRYAMVDSADYYALAEQAIDRLGAIRVEAAVERVDGDGLVHTTAGRVRAGWVLDSRPAPPALPATVHLLQHFHGWWLDCPRETFDPAVAILMDFSVPQPEVGVGFGYVLPTSAHRALVEYTEFSPAPLYAAGYERALAGYLRRRFGLGPGQFRVERTESGVIPMTDAVPRTRLGPRVHAWGAAAGATRGSTGYAFAAMQRQAAAVARDVVRGRPPVPPRAYPRRHRWLDSALLRAVADGWVDPAELFTTLLTEQPPERVFDVLDGLSGPGGELALMAGAPRGPMFAATVVDLRARLGRRLTAARAASGGRSGTPPPGSAPAGGQAGAGDQAGVPGSGYSPACSARNRLTRGQEARIR